jgi:antitoxin HigA-1
MSYPAKRNPDFRPTHPGAILREDILPKFWMTQDAVATHLGITAEKFEAILAERAPITAEIARGLGLIFSGGTIWIRMQKAHDDWNPPA